MNPIIVFAKTEEGEDAVLQRTRLVQRNLRTVLILVDGKSTVEELVEKAGSVEMVTLALDQLEKDGFVRRVGTGARKEKPISKPASQAVSNASPSAAETERPAKPVVPVVKVEVDIDGPDVGDEKDADPIAPFPPLAPSVKTVSSSKPKPAPPTSPFDTTTPAKPSASPFTGLPSEPEMSAFSVSPFSQSPSTPGQAKVGSPFQSSTASPFGASPFDTSPAAAPRGAGPSSDEPAKAEVSTEPSKPFRRRQPIFTAKRVASAVAALSLLLILTVLFYPYEKYQPAIEANLSQSLGQKVRIGSVSASFAPAPALVLSQVSIGEGAQITVGEVRAVPSVLSLFSSKKGFSQITLVNTQVPMEQIGLLASGLGATARADAFSIGGVVFSDITVGLRDLSLSRYSGHAEMTSAGGLKRMELVSPDKTLKLTVETASGGTVVSIEGTDWKPGESSPYVFDSLSITGELTGTELRAQKIEGRIFGGVIQGRFALDWSAGMAVNGDVNVDYMSAPVLGNALGSGKLSVDGQVNARIRFRASGESWNALAGKVPLEGDVIMKNGSITGMDLVESVRRGSTLAMRGGATRFEQATGKFRWDGQALRIHDIDLSSGVMRATGYLGVLKGDQISGSINVVLRGSATTVSTPVSITGTLQDPQLFGGRR